MATKQKRTKTAAKRKTAAKGWRVGEAAMIRMPGGRMVRAVRDPDVDEIIWNGKPLTNERIDEITTAAVAAYRRQRGRPSLSGQTTRARSPQVAFRLPPQLLALAEKTAAKTGQSFSEMARAALAEWLERRSAAAGGVR